MSLNTELVTVRLPFAIIEELDNLVETGLYPNRSEIIRDAIRKLLWELRKNGVLRREEK